MNKKLLVLLPLIPLLFACNEKPNPEPQKEDDETHLVDFSTTSTGFNNSNSGTFNTKMKAFVNGGKEIVAAVTNAGYVQVSQLDMANSVEKGDVTVLHALIPSSGSKDGKITFSFSVAVSKVKVYAQPYYKTYVDGGNEPFINISKDQNSKLKINNETWNLTQEKEADEIPDKVEKEFIITANSLTIEGYAKERVFIHKLEFTLA